MSNFSDNLDVYRYDYMNYKTMVCDIMDGTENISGTKTVDVLYYNSLSKFELSHECVVFDIQLELIPRILNDRSFTSAFGIDEPKCIVVPFNATVNASNTLRLMSGALIKLFFPKWITSMTIYDKHNRESLRLKSITTLPVDDTSWDKYLGRKFKSSYSGGIHGEKYYRTHTIVFTGASDKLLPKYAELAVHMSIPYNEHFGQSALTWYDLRPNVFSSILFSNILFNNKKSILVNGTMICDDFCKFYLGSPTTED